MCQFRIRRTDGRIFFGFDDFLDPAELFILFVRVSAFKAPIIVALLRYSKYSVFFVFINLSFVPCSWQRQKASTEPEPEPERFKWIMKFLWPILCAFKCNKEIDGHKPHTQLICRRKRCKTNGISIRFHYHDTRTRTRLLTMK